MTVPELDSPQTPSEPPPAGSGDGTALLWIAPAAVVLGFVAALFSQLFVELVGTAFGSPLAHPTPAVSLLADLLFDLSFVGAALYFAVLSGRMGTRDFGYVRTRWRVGIGAFVVAGIVYYLLTDVYASLLSLHSDDRLPNELGATRSTAALIGSAIFVCAVAPMCEEFFFRGFLFGVLRRIPGRIAGRAIGPWAATLIVAVLFGAAHSGSAPASDLVPLGFLGAVLCLVRWRTGSLYPCMALHSFNNGLALGVNELGWNAWQITLLLLASFAIIALVTGPLSGRVRPPLVKRPFD